MKYINTPYENSAAYHSVMRANIIQLQTRRPYTVNAIHFHEREGNAGQVEFFTAELALIDKRIKLLETPEPIYTCPTCGALHEDGGRGKHPVYCDKCGADWER